MTIEISEIVVEAACLSLAKQEGLEWPDDYGRDVEQLRVRIGEALQAALAEMLEPVGWKYAGLFPNVPKFREDRADGYIDRIYTIKGQPK